jgi:signal transduction histidine kinase
VDGRRHRERRRRCALRVLRCRRRVVRRRGAGVGTRLDSDDLPERRRRDLELGVSVETDATVARVRIADTGSGIPDDQKEAVFRRGEIGHAKATGSGFGLFFVDSMVEAYGGRVWVEDRTPTNSVLSGTDRSGGAVFVVELPLTNAAADNVADRTR